MLHQFKLARYVQLRLHGDFGLIGFMLPQFELAQSVELQPYNAIAFSSPTALIKLKTYFISILYLRHRHESDAPELTLALKLLCRLSVFSKSLCSRDDYMMVQIQLDSTDICQALIHLLGVSLM